MNGNSHITEHYFRLRTVQQKTGVSTQQPAVVSVFTCLKLFKKLSFSRQGLHKYLIMTSPTMTCLYAYKLICELNFFQLTLYFRLI